ncbi:hypothetical protein EPN81_01535 [Patescibacteria group bacterium]|nr:MAG: hypothetical protein EPN81_01535 [Patescibacteria group bacterium]
MGESTVCLRARASLEEIRSLKREFDFAYDLASYLGKEDDIVRARELQGELEKKMKAIQETLNIVEAERLFDLKRQYDSQTALLRKAGLLETKKEKSASGVEREIFFITGIDGKEYPMPSYKL